MNVKIFYRESQYNTAYRRHITKYRFVNRTGYIRKIEDGSLYYFPLVNRSGNIITSLTGNIITTDSVLDTDSWTITGINLLPIEALEIALKIC